MSENREMEFLHRHNPLIFAFRLVGDCVLQFFLINERNNVLVYKIRWMFFIKTEFLCKNVF